MHASGKEEAAIDICKSSGAKLGQTFTTCNTNSKEIGIDNKTLYSNEDVIKMFENKAYLFIKECTDYDYPFYVGLSMFDYDNNDVFVLSPDEFISIPKFNSEVCFIWMDCSALERKHRYMTERRSYDFTKKEELENRDSDEFISKIYNTPNSHLIYFSNEDPMRVSAVVQALIQHPDLITVFERRYN